MSDEYEEIINKAYRLLEDRISELEASSASHTEKIEGNYEYIMNYIGEVKQEIAELRENNLEQEQHIQRLEGCVSDCQEELNELKAQIECVFLKTEELNAKHLNNKEVLRELTELQKEMIHCFMGIQKLSKTVSLSVFGEWLQTTIRLLEKLDVGSARQTDSEKKDIEASKRWLDDAAEWEMDSGGEKEVKINQKNLGMLAGQTPAILNDSKLPEPKSYVERYDEYWEKMCPNEPREVDVDKTSWCLGYLEGIKIMALGKQELISDIAEIFGKIEGIIENISEEIESIGDWDTKEDLVALVNQFDGYISLQKKKWEKRSK